MPEFSVFEDGVTQAPHVLQNRRQQPIALSLLLDSSASMEDKLPRSRRRPELRPPAEANDLAQVIDFDSRVEVRQASPHQSELRRPST
jgi:hypothetical protein